MSNTTNETRTRNPNLDLIRIIACLCVILVHTTFIAAMTPCTEKGWSFLHSAHTVANAGNILFLMISGSLLLSEEYSFCARKFYGRNFLRLLISYILWLLIFNIAGVLLYGASEDKNLLQILHDIITDTILGNASYHFWFIPMLLGLYLILPMLRAICHAEKWIPVYFVILFLTVQILFPTILYFEFPHKYLFESMMTRIPFTLINHYAGFFVLGHVLTCFLKEKRILRPALAGFLFLVAGVFSAHFGELLLLKQMGETTGTYMNETFTLCPCMIAVGIFLLIHGIRFSPSHQTGAFLKKISGLTFGIYMMHPLFVDHIRALINRLPVSVILRIPLQTLLTFLIAAAATFFLSLLPPVKKWLLFG